MRSHVATGSLALVGSRCSARTNQQALTFCLWKGLWYFALSGFKHIPRRVPLAPRSPYVVKSVLLSDGVELGSGPGAAQMHILSYDNSSCLGYPEDPAQWDMLRTFSCSRREGGEMRAEWEGKGVVWNVVRQMQRLEPPVQGVSLGGWLVVEKWMTPNVFAYAEGAEDQWTLTENLGYDRAKVTPPQFSSVSPSQHRMRTRNAAGYRGTSYLFAGGGRLSVPWMKSLKCMS